MVVLRRCINFIRVLDVLDTNGRFEFVTSKASCIARTNRAFVRAVAGFAAFFAYCGFNSRAVTSVVALRLEHAIAIAALVLRARKARSAFVGRAAAFAASLPSRAVASVVALRFERAYAVCALVA